MDANEVYWGVLLARLIVCPLKERRGLKRASYLLFCCGFDLLNLLIDYSI